MTTEVLPMPVPEAKEIETKALTITDQANNIQINDQASYDRAVDLVKAVKELRKEAEEHHRPVIDAAHKAHKAACEALNKIDGPLKLAENTIKVKIGGWEMEQSRIRAEAERKAREEAERLQAEQIEEKIEEMEAGGASAVEVAEVISQAKVMPTYTPPAAVTYRKASGVSTTKVYKAEITNVVAFIKAALANPMFTPILGNPKVLDALNPQLTKIAQAAGGVLNIAGVQVREVPNVRIGGR